MSNLSYVCLSDLHCGAPTGLLTVKAAAQSVSPLAIDPVSKLSLTFAAALRMTVAGLKPATPPNLVLLGDVLDLSLSPPKAAIKGLRNFLSDLTANGKSNPFGKALVVPGNHDHELWTAQRLQGFGKSPVSGNEDDRWRHTTPAFAAPDRLAGSTILDDVLKTFGFTTGTATYYPNLGLLSTDKTRAVVLHHGHYIEAMYLVMSQMLPLLSGAEHAEETVESLEMANASWIDFIWSTIGDDGILGDDVFLIYEYLMTGGESAGFQQRLSALIAARLGRALPVPRTADVAKMLSLMANTLVDGVAGSMGQLERFSYTSVLGAASLAGLCRYLQGPTRQQITAELGGAVPEDVTFIFGHTHKPFEDRLPVAGFARPVAIYNIGGWILDTPMFGTVEGASALFIDDALNVASLRLFTAPAEDGPAPKRNVPPLVRVATADGDATNPMAKALAAVIAVPAVAAAWVAFAVEADAAYRETQAMILEILGRSDRDAKARGKLL